MRILGAVALGGLLVGGLTFFGQRVLPFGLSPLANSSGAWCLAAFLMATANRRPRLGLLLGFVALATMLAGYDVVSEARGFGAGRSLWLFWGVAALFVGPALGVGAAWVRGANPVRAAAGIGVLSGILVGEGVYGLTIVAETTPAGYWMVQMVVGVGIAVAASLRRPRRAERLAVASVLTVVVAAAFYVGYSGDLIRLVP